MSALSWPRAIPLLVIAASSCAPHPSTRGPGVAMPASLPPQVRVLDNFEAPSGWTGHPAEGVDLRIGQDQGRRGQAMRLDFDFRSGAGYAIARKAIPLKLPDNYEFSFWIRADAPVNNLEFKLIDPSGDNVWWVNRRSFDFPREWQQIRIRKQHIRFAWGPKGGGDIDSVAALEIVVAAGTGGKGTVWIDDLTFREREASAPYTLTPVLTASSATGKAARALDRDTSTAWRSSGSGPEWLAVDFLREREFGGLTVHWDRTDYATSYSVQTSGDGTQWETVYTVERGNGGRDPIYLPDHEARHVRLRLLQSSRGQGYAIRDIVVQPVEWSSSPNAFFTSLAGEVPRGTYPRYLTGEQSYWTVLGVNGAMREALINTEGMVETGLGGPSLEPFLYVDGRLVTWNDVRTTQSLAKEYLPIPSVEWQGAPLGLRITTFAVGEIDASTVYARYRVENRSNQRQDATLFLALRPFQVNPPWQFLNVLGGAARVREVAFDNRAITVNGQPTVFPVTTPSSFGALAFDQGDVVEYLREGRLPEGGRAADPRGFASGVLAYQLDLPPGGSRDILVAIPLQEGAPIETARSDAEASRLGERLLASTIRRWEADLDRFTIRLPASAQRIANSVKSNLAYILINRDGPSIQPGSRAYDRSWIRDGSLTSAALLRLGHPEEVRAFAEWYAPHQRPNGYVPCCVSFGGADPVPEHDSHGQLIYLIAEYHRFSKDRAFLMKMWPYVERAVAYIDTLRHERMTPEYQTPEKRAFYGLVPQSISHEGYSAKPMHSFWDDFFVLKGLKDAVYVAGVLGRDADRARFARIRDEFRRDVLESLRLTMANHKIDFLPGSVELGDFDATSTTVAVAPVGERANLPQAALERTFERYYQQSIRARREGREPWEGYTPYEWRTVGTFVRLGWKERAHEAIELFFGHQRPPAWNHWAEVVFRDPKTPRFIGDMPHTWVGSDFIRSTLDLFAYERDSDSALVVGAGVPAEWVASEPGVTIEGLRTYYGPLSLRMRAEANTVRVRLGGGLSVPPGGIVVRSPLSRPIRRATVNGRSVQTGAEQVIINRLPAEIVLEH